MQAYPTLAGREAASLAINENFTICMESAMPEQPKFTPPLTSDWQLKLIPSSERLQTSILLNFTNNGNRCNSHKEYPRQSMLDWSFAVYRNTLHNR